jgi:23S rRNA (pseudouridine1915-N3)-methyltransferase
MATHLLAIGRKMPAWVQAGYDEYQKRLPAHLKFRLKELELSNQSSADARKTDECERLSAAQPSGSFRIALDARGAALSTESLAEKLNTWLQLGRDLVFVIGGPEGLTDAYLKQADARISLSALTLPHPLVRVVLSEQIYRAHSILNGHPYHRG